MKQELNNTQYGFRASCSTSYPIHIIRRALEKAEREGSIALLGARLENGLRQAQARPDQEGTGKAFGAGGFDRGNRVFIRQPSILDRNRQGPKLDPPAKTGDQTRVHVEPVPIHHSHELTGGNGTAHGRLQKGHQGTGAFPTQNC